MELVFENQRVMIEPSKINRDRAYSASYFSFEKLHLEYIPYLLSIEFSIETEQSTLLKKKLEVHLYQDYQEYRSNDFWDKIMSV